MDFGARNIINGLPNALICHILSFLSTKEAASTSVLSKSWRFLFAFVTSLDFDDSIYLHRKVDKQVRYMTPRSFVDFVDRVLAFQGNGTLSKFSLKCNGYVDLVRVTGWIFNVLERGVSDLDLSLLELDYPLPSKVFMSKTLVKLKLGHLSFTIDVEDVFLPKLKTLHLDSVKFEKRGVGFAKLLSGCPVLEELVMMNIEWENWKFCSVSIATLKRLTFLGEDNDENPKSVSFVTPNLVYLEYTDTIANKYPKVNFDSLIEARICLPLTENQMFTACLRGNNYNSSDDMVGNATDFLMGMCNVQILYLSSEALEVLTLCCEKTPVLNNLIQLTIESVSEDGRKSLLGLLKNCPNLETLVLKGCVRIFNNRCEYKRWSKSQESIPSCISSSPVKVLKIFMFGYNNYDLMEIEQIKHFLENMPRLEHLIVYYNRSYDHAVFELSKKLHKIPRIASPKCKIKVISENYHFSCTLPSSSAKWSVPPKEDYSWLSL